MAVGPQLRLMDGDEGLPRNGGDKGSSSAGVGRAQAAMRRFFLSNTTRAQLAPETVRKLDDIRSRGTSLLAALRPYASANVHTLEMARRLSYGGSVRPGTLQLIESNLDAAASFMGEHFTVFPASEGKRNRDLETTCVLSAFFFVAGVARYGPDVILESTAPAEAKQALAEKFIGFFDARLADFMDIEKKRENPRDFHKACLAAYQQFQQELPGIFNGLRVRFKMSTGQMMAYLGDERFTTHWTDLHYEGRL